MEFLKKNAPPEFKTALFASRLCIGSVGQVRGAKKVLDQLIFVL